MKILDLTAFLDEVELLKVRIEEHWNYVDKIIVAEAPSTYARQSKSYVFLDNIEQFKPYLDKVEHYPVEVATPDGEGFFGNDTRVNERIQRYLCFVQYPDLLASYDYCFHMDVDEIISREGWAHLRPYIEKHQPEWVRVRLRHFRNFLDWEYPVPYTTEWIKKIKGLNFWIPPTSKKRLTVAPLHYYGYHLCFMGDENRKKYKLENFVHHAEVPKETFDNLDNLTVGDTLYHREAKYGKPMIHENPKAEMPKAIQDRWNFFRGWCSK